MFKTSPKSQVRYTFSLSGGTQKYRPGAFDLNDIQNDTLIQHNI